jgi:hypothetical protein
MHRLLQVMRDMKMDDNGRIFTRNMAGMLYEKKKLDCRPGILCRRFVSYSCYWHYILKQSTRPQARHHCNMFLLH